MPRSRQLVGIFTAVSALLRPHQLLITAFWLIAS
jgi:hypothetical protein